jgi:hypothetical protein
MALYERAMATSGGDQKPMQRNFASKYRQLAGRKKSVREIADELGVTSAHVYQLLR